LLSAIPTSNCEPLKDRSVDAESLSSPRFAAMRRINPG
jgi:hypothetical protein